ncbi:hypothetical protein [Actinosynnema sp. NPDC023587]|uniref:hypothetical protein n=1 Tax=Actinosynnema sp. NPDC023587 TaxID=3154695 RepID=UPI0033CA5D77
MHAAERIEAALLAHPSVARLAGGYESYLPGKRVVGVRTEDRVGVAVVLRPGRPIPEVVAELRAVVRAVMSGVPGAAGAAGASGKSGASGASGASVPVPVDVVVADLEDP